MDQHQEEHGAEEIRFQMEPLVFTKLNLERKTWEASEMETKSRDFWIFPTMWKRN